MSIIASQNTAVSVRFNYTINNQQNIFKQPLYYLGDHIVNILGLDVNTDTKASDTTDTQNIKYDKDLIILSSNIDDTHDDTKLDDTQDDKLDDTQDDTKLDTDTKPKTKGIINLELTKSSNVNNFEFYYMLNNFNNNVKFMYDGCNFELKVLSNDNITNFTDIDEEPVIYTAYEITFNSSAINQFNKFMKTAITYYNTYYCINKMKDDYVNIYITSNDGAFFTCIGNKLKRSLDTIYIPHTQKSQLIDDITHFLKPETEALYRKLCITYKRIYLFEGIPGTGKTSLIFGIASMLNYNIAIISFSPKMTDIDLLRVLRSFSEDINDRKKSTDKKNKKKRKTLLVCEDIDCIFKERKSNDESKNSITFSGLLNALDGITTDDIICFITTNYKTNLDSALLRPGRIDYIMRFDYAIKEQIVNIYKTFTDTNDTSHHNDFYAGCIALNIKLTISLLQQYLMKYINKPLDAIKNLDEMKIMFTSATTTKDEQPGLYC